MRTFQMMSQFADDTRPAGPIITPRNVAMTSDADRGDRSTTSPASRALHRHPAATALLDRSAEMSLM